MAWLLFLSMISQLPRFQARDRLAQMDATSGAIGATFGEGNDSARDELERIAYPRVKDNGGWIEQDPQAPPPNEQPK